MIFSADLVEAAQAVADLKVPHLESWIKKSPAAGEILVGEEKAPQTHAAPGWGAAGGRVVDAVYARAMRKTARELNKLTLSCPGLTRASMIIRRGQKLMQHWLCRTPSWIAGSSPAMTKQTQTKSYATN